MKLILLPGMDGTGSLFDPLRNKLNRSIEVIVLTYPQEIDQSYKV